MTRPRLAEKSIPFALLKMSWDRSRVLITDLNSKMAMQPLHYHYYHYDYYPNPRKSQYPVPIISLATRSPLRIAPSIYPVQYGLVSVPAKCNPSALIVSA